MKISTSAITQILVLLGCTILLSLCAEKNSSLSTAFNNGQCANTDGAGGCDPNARTPDSFPNVKKAVVYQSEVIQTGDFQVWTKLWIWFEQSRTFCSHLANVQTGSVVDGQAYLSLFNINTTSYYFVTTFTNLKDNACNPDYNPTRLIQAIIIAALVFCCIWVFLAMHLGAANYVQKENKEFLRAYSIVLGFGTVLLTTATIVLSLSSFHSFCHMDGSQCTIAGSGLTAPTFVGNLSNVTCNATSCQLEWTIPPSMFTQNPQGVCYETVGIEDMLDSRFLMLNPSSKTECRAVPSSWIVNGYVVYLLFPAVVLIMMILLLPCNTPREPESERLLNREIDREIPGHDSIYVPNH